MPFQINTVTVSGNLTRDPEVRHTPSGMPIVSLAIAYNERRKNQQTGDFEDHAHFFDITVFGKFGEAVARDLGKGDPIVVSGQLEQRRWQDQQGNNRSAVSIIARDVVRGQRGGGGGGNAGGGGYAQSAPQGGDGGYGGQPQQGGWGQGGGQQGGAQPAPQQGGWQTSDVAVDQSDFAPAPRGGLSDPGEDDIPF